MQWGPRPPPRVIHNHTEACLLLFARVLLLSCSSPPKDIDLRGKVAVVTGEPHPARGVPLPADAIGPRLTVTQQPVVARLTLQMPFSDHHLSAAGTVVLSPCDTTFLPPSRPGGSSGVAKEVIKDLAARGATVYAGCR